MSNLAEYDGHKFFDASKEDLKIGKDKAEKDADKKIKVRGGPLSTAMSESSLQGHRLGVCQGGCPTDGNADGDQAFRHHRNLVVTPKPCLLHPATPYCQTENLYFYKIRRQSTRI